MDSCLYTDKKEFGGASCVFDLKSDFSLQMVS